MKRLVKNLLPVSFFIIVSLLAFDTVAQESQSELFAKANDLYKEKDYPGAIELYDSIVDMGYTSADLYYNLGNAYFKTGYLAPAILNYERAKKLDPTDEDIEFNLKIANLRVADRIEAVPELFFIRWIKNFVVTQSSDGWARLGITFMWAAFVCGCVFLFVNSVAAKRIAFILGILVFIISIALGVVAYDQYKYQRNSQEGIIFVTNAYVKSAPDPESADLFMLREGVKVELKNIEGNWQRIQLADGKVGWVRKEQVEKI